MIGYAPDPFALAADRLMPNVGTLRAPSFANDQQQAFFESRAPELLYSGAMGAGKSRILCEKAWAIALQYPGVTIGIFRKVRASIAATTYRTFTRDVMDASLVSGRNLSEGWIELTNRSRIYFLGLDPDPLTGVPSKVGSLDLACAYVDEAVELVPSDWIMLIGRLRDPRIPWHQIGAATNPGPATHWLKARFTPADERHVYLHATAADNRFLPADYQAAIAALSGGTDTATMRLVDGLWVNAEGAIWTLPDAQVRAPDQEAWHRRVAGVDWGFQHAFAVEAVAESGTGRRAVLGEISERGWTIDDVIPALKAFMVLHGIEEFFADPSEPAYIRQCRDAGLPMMAATNDVLPGITAVAQSFRAGMTVDPSCTGLLGEIPGYVWKRDRATGNTIDVPVKVGDDNCLVAGTMIATERGPVPIEAVRVGDRVFTRSGLRPVIAAGMTSPNALVVELRMADGRVLTGTPNHPVYVAGSGFVRLDALRYGMMAECQPKSSSFAGSSSGATPNRAGWLTACTSLRVAGIVRVASRIFTGRSGRTQTGRSLTGTTSTTTTVTRSTTIRPILSASRATSIWLPTPACPGSSAPNVERPWTAFARLLRPGIERMRAALGIASMAAMGGLSGNRSLALAISAGNSSTRSLADPTTAFARTPASPRGDALRDSTTNSARALPAVRASRRTAMRGPGRALVAVDRVSERTARTPVYNLTVAGNHEYFANGILTHNCDALRYACMGLEAGGWGSFYRDETAALHKRDVAA